MKCKECDYEYLNNNDLHAHEEIDHKNKPDGAYRYQCEICGTKWCSIQAYLTHMNKTHRLDKKALYDLYHKGPNDGKCTICGEPTKWAPPRIRKWGYDPLCRNHRREESNRLRRDTCKEKYGSDHASQTDEVKKRTKQTLVDRYGTDNLMTLPEHRAKITKTCIERYGVEQPSTLDSFKSKVRSTNMHRYGAQKDMPAESLRILKDPSEMLKRYQECGSGEEIASELSVSLKTVYDYLHLHNIDIIPGKSSEERQFYRILDLLGVRYETSVRGLLGQRELDIYIPEHKLAIEYDGVYWRTERMRSPRYHLEKTIACEQLGIQLLHVFSTDDLSIWESVIQSKLGLVKRIGARECKVCLPDKDSVRKFLSDNHIQGSIEGTINIGLSYKGNLVSLGVFGSARFTKDYEYELLRFCNLKGYQVVGGASRILKHSRIKSCVSYANRRWSNGKLYRALGFQLIRETSPNYYYTLDHKTIHSRMKFQKHKLPHLLPNFDGSLSEAENMYAHGYDRIFDCGNLVYGLRTD